MIFTHENEKKRTLTVHLDVLVEDYALKKRGRKIGFLN
jgi:hypothetical protein